MADDGKLDTVLSIIHRRKSVRSYIHHRTVSREVLMNLVRAGMAAPTSRNSQPWEFIVINDKELIKGVAATTPYAEMLNDAGNAIIIAGNPRRFEKGTPEFWIQDCAAATENILITVEAMGLGAVWCGVYPIEDRMNSLKATLNLPEHIIPFNIISIGYPTGYETAQNKWDLKKFHWNGW